MRCSSSGGSPDQSSLPSGSVTLMFLKLTLVSQLPTPTRPLGRRSFVASKIFSPSRKHDSLLPRSLAVSLYHWSFSIDLGWDGVSWLHLPLSSWPTTAHLFVRVPTTKAPK